MAGIERGGEGKVRGGNGKERWDNYYENTERETNLKCYKKRPSNAGNPIVDGQPKRPTMHEIDNYFGFIMILNKVGKHQHLKGKVKGIVT